MPDPARYALVFLNPAEAKRKPGKNQTGEAMIVEVKVPQLSESVAEATLLDWHKREGEAGSRDENLIDTEGKGSSVSPAKPAAPAKAPPPVMPSAQKLASEQGVDTSKILGTGRDGRITKGDVLEHAGKPGSAAAAPAAAKPAMPQPSPPGGVEPPLAGPPAQ